MAGSASNWYAQHVSCYFWRINRTCDIREGFKSLFMTRSPKYWTDFCVFLGDFMGFPVSLSPRVRKPVGFNKANLPNRSLQDKDISLHWVSVVWFWPMSPWNLFSLDLFCFLRLIDRIISSCNKRWRMYNVQPANPFVLCFGGWDPWKPRSCIFALAPTKHF